MKGESWRGCCRLIIILFFPVSSEVCLYVTAENSLPEQWKRRRPLTYILATRDHPILLHHHSLMSHVCVCVCVLPSIFLCQWWWKLQPQSLKTLSFYQCICSGLTGWRHCVTCWTYMNISNILMVKYSMWLLLFYDCFCVQPCLFDFMHMNALECDKRYKHFLRFSIVGRHTHTRTLCASQTEGWQGVPV